MKSFPKVKLPTFLEFEGKSVKAPNRMLKLKDRIDGFQKKKFLKFLKNVCKLEKQKQKKIAKRKQESLKSSHNEPSKVEPEKIVPENVLDVFELKRYSGPELEWIVCSLMTWAITGDTITVSPIQDDQVEKRQSLPEFFHDHSLLFIQTQKVAENTENVNELLKHLRKNTQIKKILFPEFIQDIKRVLFESPAKKQICDKSNQQAEIKDETVIDQEWASSDDEEEDGTIKETIEKRKNRRGQQARRAIWEKKFGQKATHIVQEKTKKKEPKKNKDVPLKSAPIVPIDESLHPSWVAKKMAEQAKAKLMSSAKATKIVFD